MQAPKAPVAATVGVSEPARGTVSPQLLAWTTATWQTPQTLTLDVDSQVGPLSCQQRGRAKSTRSGQPDLNHQGPD